MNNNRKLTPNFNEIHILALFLLIEKKNYLSRAPPSGEEKMVMIGHSINIILDELLYYYSYVAYGIIIYGITNN